MWCLIFQLCEQRNLTLTPHSIHIDCEQAMHNVILRVLPGTKIDCCRFHLGQSWWRKIQDLGLSTGYKEKTCDIGKWLSLFVGLPFLPPEQIEECFVEEWSTRNDMIINTMKSKSMIMRSSRKIQYLESDFNIFYDDVLLNDVKYEKLLGITLDNCLSWC